jgi:alginate O-acetyltransferase complex protein AlgI
VLLIRQANLRRGPDGRWPAIHAGVRRTRAMWAVVAISVVANLALLAYFKYYNFAQESIESLARSLGGHGVLPVLDVALPVGISFYTFQSMSYCIDVYRGHARPMTNLLDFCCFEAMFPQLVAGPIVRYGDVSEQMRRRSHTPEKFARGVAFFSLGLAKKVLIANAVAPVADLAFAARAPAVADAWAGLFAYAMQIYFDFSGYSDMAVGLGLMFGFELVRNFDSPYRSASLTEFWRRWHISLSTWLRDYLYIPLGGSRGGPVRTYCNLLTVMLIGGLWHGASWNFVIWGGLHGGLLAAERASAGTRLSALLPRPAKVVLTFGFVCVGWVFFRADDLPAAFGYLSAMAGVSGDGAAEVLRGMMYGPYALATLCAAAVIVWTTPQTWAFTARLSPARAAWCGVAFAAAVAVMWTQSDDPFLYFRF